MIPDNVSNANSIDIIQLREVDKTMISLVGGKAANLGELCRMREIQVPAGFCITTSVYKNITENKRFDNLLNELAKLTINDTKSIRELSATIRAAIKAIQIPQVIIAKIEGELTGFNKNEAFAVRSSATAEDLPLASFAGQQDSYLNIIGTAAILKSISRCWASLFTYRAVIYRIQNGFHHRNVQLAVIIQQMALPQAAGILFTADPLSGNRKVLSIDAGFGLGEGMVSGLMRADLYKVIDGKFFEKVVATKKNAVCALKEGGTQQQPIAPTQQHSQVLTDEQILQLERIGREIEIHFDSPQDIEWCLACNTFYILQSRPITTLYPIPESGDGDNRVYVSVGHQQMMTDPMKPLGLSFWQLRAARPMFKAGGRLFVDVTDMLATPAGRVNLLDAMGQHDPLIKDALQAIIERGNFIKSLPDIEKEPVLAKSTKGMSAAAILAQGGDNPAVVTDLIEQSEISLETLKQNIQTKSGTDLFNFILEDIQESKKATFNTQHMAVVLAAMNAASWINENMEEWLGEKNVADILSQSVLNNVTSAMGLALLDVADTIRPYPAIIEYLKLVKTDDFLNQIIMFDGGEEVRNAIVAYLDKYGMRCAGEIDITKTRWSEKPTILVPIILSNVKTFDPGAGKHKFLRGRQEALAKEQMLLDRLRQLPDGEQKAKETKAMIDLLRNFAGYREYPKYGIVSRFFVYKQALLNEVEKLTQASVIKNREDAYYLTFAELGEMVRTLKPQNQLIGKRKDEFKLHEKLNPPRVITSDGEIISGKYSRENLPATAIAGLAVSAGIVEGRARVVLKMEDADLQDGDILVTTFTDPSWTPLFVFIKGLVTEVGGLMTHGAVIAREYGIPAVVGVDDACKLVKDGQRISVNAISGYIELL